MKLQVICSDIDGTLLDKDRSLSDATLEVISSLRNEVKVILASSRMPSAMTYLQKELKILHMPLICYNGAYVIDGEGNVLVSEWIPLETLKDLLDMDLNEKMNISVYSENRWFAEREDQWTLREINNTRVKPEMSPLAETIKLLEEQGKSAHKVMCMGEKELIDQIVRGLSPYSKSLNLYRSKDTYLEISSNAMNKATALDILLQSSSPVIDWQDVISFGDNYNDIELLTASGIGVAVDNAKDEVKQVANILTTKNTEDGVAEELRRQFF